MFSKITSKIIWKLVIVTHLFTISLFICEEDLMASDLDRKWFVSLNLGSQMSGIKSEDFVYSNYSPLLRLSVGKWFSREMALNVGYQGFYYYSISDDNRHSYNYFFGEAIFDVHYLFLGENNERIWTAHIHAGSGYLNNKSTGQPNIIATTTSISNNFKIADNLCISLTTSAIMGWNIYQGDEDILPGVALGISYRF